MYGTLRRGECAEAVVAADVARRVPARARARLLPIGAPYPAAVFAPDAGVLDVLDGELLWLRPGRYAETLDRVDQYENVPFLFRRMAVMVEAEGKQIEAWVYSYAHASHAIR